MENKFGLLNDLMYTMLNRTKSIHGKEYIVMGEGNYASNTLIVGEALGKNEELQKRIFIGKSGQLLRKVLKCSNIESKMFFINSIPWRPDNNRTPYIHEIEFYAPYWQELINILNIENIYCIGKQAEKLLSFIKLSNINLFKTYHPAYYLRTHRKDVMEHMINTSLSVSLVCKCTEDIFHVFTQSSQRSS